MLYNSTRERLLQLGTGYTAMIADALFKAEFNPLQRFTVAQAIEATKPLGIPAKIVRAGLNHDIFSKRGRRNQVFTMPSPEHARKVVGASVLSIRDDLPATAFKSLKAYRMALHHALIVRRPGKYTRGLLSRRIGVCKQTTRNYDKECGHVVSEQHDTRPLLPGDLDTMPTAKTKGGKRKTWLGRIGEGGFIEQFAPMVKAIAIQWHRKGYQVVILEQTASHYQPSIVSEYTSGKYADFIES